jgi:cob(I)alamin adenosyltransferase
MALRASGHGLQTLILQFIKADSSTGELTGLKYLPGTEVIQMGRGFVPSPTHPAFSEHCQAARHALRKAVEAIRSKKYDLIILDEICTAMSKGLITEDQILKFLDLGSEDSCLVLTGRGATDGLISKADTVTEMRCLKHGLREGITAQKGVEY